jgi:hypothetical protein
MVVSIYWKILTLAISYITVGNSEVYGFSICENYTLFFAFFYYSIYISKNQASLVNVEISILFQAKLSNFFYFVLFFLFPLISRLNANQYNAVISMCLSFNKLIVVQNLARF